MRIVRHKLGKDVVLAVISKKAEILFESLFIQPYSLRTVVNKQFFECKILILRRSVFYRR